MNVLMGLKNTINTNLPIISMEYSQPTIDSFKRKNISLFDIIPNIYIVKVFNEIGTRSFKLSEFNPYEEGQIILIPQHHYNSALRNL